jgi:hypothetical protein
VCSSDLVDMAAFQDRITFWYFVEYLSPDGFADLLSLKANGQSNPTTSTTLSAADLFLLQQLATSLPIPPSIQATLATLRQTLIDQGVIVSDRRWVWALDAIRANALLEGATAIDEDHLTILEHVLWNLPEQRRVITKLVGRLSNPLNAQAKELKDQAKGLVDELLTLTKARAKKDWGTAPTDTYSALKGLAIEAHALLDQVKAEGRNPATAAKAVEAIDASLPIVLEIIAPTPKRAGR